ncbi:MAG: peptidoglycan DD-metalloendopeptidase family protein [Bacteroidia bacterium]
MKFHLAIKRISVALVLVLVALVGAKAQSRTDLEKQREQKLKEIAFTEKLISQTSSEKKKNLNYLYILQRQIKNREQLINTENKVLKLLNRSIDQTTLFIAALENDLATLKNEYVEMAYYAFKNRSKFDYLLYIFASNSLQEAWNRMRYIRYYNEIRTNQIELIQETQKSLGRKIENLKLQIANKQILVQNLAKEKDKLGKDVKSKNALLQELKGKENEYKEKLKKDKKAAKELDKAIEEIIKAELARAEAAEATDIEISGLSSDQFASNRSNFMWPSRGIVSQGFGRQEHPTISGVYINNNGINIRTEKDATARSVFPGTVVHVVFIPGANNAIIIRHGDYYTVYKNLIEVAVNPGDDVEEGQALGKVSFDEEKEIAELHFEIRYKTEKLNPQLWLKKE